MQPLSAQPLCTPGCSGITPACWGAQCQQVQGGELAQGGCAKPTVSCSPSKKKMQCISNISIMVMYLMYFLAALFGYLTFYGEPLGRWPGTLLACWHLGLGWGCAWQCQGSPSDSLMVPAGRVESELLHTYNKVDPFDVLILCVRVAVLTAVTLTVPIVLFPVSGSMGIPGGITLPQPKHSTRL